MNGARAAAGVLLSEEPGPVHCYYLGSCFTSVEKWPGNDAITKGIKKPFSKPQFRIPHETRAEGIAGNSALQVPTVQLD